jgi:hypothetical protein
MDKSLKPLTDYLVALEIEKVPHTQSTYLKHLISVYHFMRQQGCTEEVCRAGLFHSIYGTELFQGFKLPLDRRGELRELIGQRAEQLAYWNCAMDRTSFDRALDQTIGPYCFVDRITGQSVELDGRDYDDLCRVHLYDFLEQVPRSQWWDYRRDSYRRMANRLGGRASEAYDEAFAAAPAAKKP